MLVSKLKEYPVETRKGNDVNDKFRCLHPSFGMIDIARIGGGSGFNLFGDERATSAFSINISHALVSQGLGRSWYHAETSIVDVMLSSNQFSEFIMTNGSVVPCTIQFSESEGRHRCSKPVSKEDHLNVNVVGLEEFKNEVHRLKSEIEKLLKAKGSLKKAEKEEIVSLTKKLKLFVDENASNIKKNALSAIDDVQQRTNEIIQNEVDLAVGRFAKTGYVDGSRQIN